jgi:hypothetical protein
VQGVGCVEKKRKATILSKQQGKEKKEDARA